MKHIIAITTAIILGACTDAELIDISQGQCDQIGYAPGTAEHTQCVERGFRGTKAAQDEAISNAIIGTALMAAFY